MRVLVSAFSLILAVSFISPNVLAKEEHQIAIMAFDALTEKDMPVELYCKIERRNILHNDVRHANVNVFVNGTLIAKTITDHAGVVRLSYTPKNLGTYTIVFECEEGEGHAKATASARLFCRDKKRPAIVIDIDNTIADITMEKFLLTKTKDIKRLPGSKEVLEDLAKTYDLIFLTARDEHLLHRTRDWLAMNQFPPAPVFFRELGKDPLSERKFKTDKIAQMKATWSNIAYGVGDKLSDAQAYVANGLEAFILSRKEVLPKRAHCVENWKMIKAALKNLSISKINAKESR